MSRTWCKYGDCSLEKLENELKVLKKIWDRLEKSWADPDDIEDVYRIYPLLDTTAAIARKMLHQLDGKKDRRYPVKVVMPKNRKTVDTSKYLYSDEYTFFNGEKRQMALIDVASKFLHESECKYTDTRKSINDSNFEIYIYVRTDVLCDSCANANLKNPKGKGQNFRKTTGFTQYNDCTCGQYINVQSYISSISKLLHDRTQVKK